MSTFANKTKTLGITVSAAAVALGTAALFTAPEQAAFGSAPLAHRAHQTAPAENQPATLAEFPYKSAQFTQFIKTSYEGAPAGTPDFYAFLERGYKHTGIRFKGKEKAPSITALLASVKKDYLATSDPAKRATMEKQTGAFAHRLVKKAIPKFSLNRGFEFYSAVKYGQRQCYLQSVLVSGMLQAAGMKAGVVMVARNEHGQATNNGHAVSLVKLSDGSDVLVDVSHKLPFIRQQGLMVADTQTGAYRYVAPRYAATGDAITGYASYEGPDSLPTTGVLPLPLGFVVSQFDYYRGERAPGGFADKTKTPEGWEASARFLRRAVSEDPQNPLAQYVLGRVYLRQNKNDEARRQIVQSVRLYESYGFVPQGPHDSLTLVGAAPPPPQAVANR